MAIYTTFFLATPAELHDGFPGWKPRLPEPVRREFRNPFTKQLVSIETREPEWPAEAEGIASNQHRVVPVQGRYEDYLESRLPPFVRESCHWAAKGLTDVELEPLLGAVVVNTILESPIYAPPSSGAALWEFPVDFIPKLIEIDQAEVSARWAAAMSTPEHTHSATGKKLSDGWTTHQALQILMPIVSLARKAIHQKMYLLVES